MTHKKKIAALAQESLLISLVLSLSLIPIIAVAVELCCRSFSDPRRQPRKCRKKREISLTLKTQHRSVGFWIVERVINQDQVERERGQKEKRKKKRTKILGSFLVLWV